MTEFEKQVLQYIEIDVDHCSLTYGVSPCTASLVSSPPTGTRKCFNTPNTCQDRENFDNEPVTLRFAVGTAFLPKDIEAIPAIKFNGIEFQPGVISLGENLGQRASLTVKFRDFPHSDTGVGGDKYLAERDYNPYEQGTYFGKFRVRHAFVRGRPLRWITGFVGQSLDQMTVRHFIIDSFSGPTLDGEFQLVAKDVLKFADSDRALAPRPNSGYLSAGIDSSTLSAALAPVGIGNEEYAASGYLNLGGKEIVSFTRSGDTLTFGARAQLGTTASAHAAQDRVQQVLRYVAQTPATIVGDLLMTYADVPSAYVPLPTWEAESDDFYGALFTVTIANPTAVSALLTEIIGHGFALGWDEVRRQVLFQVLRGIDSSAIEINDRNIQGGSLGIQDQHDKRLSQAITYFALRNPLTSLTDEANYDSVAILKDDDAEADYGSAAIQKFFSRFIPTGGLTVAGRRNEVLLGRRRDPPRKFSFKLLKDSVPTEPFQLDGLRLYGGPIQDDTGAATYAACQVTRVNPGEAGSSIVSVEAEEMLYTAFGADLTTRTVVLTTSTNNVNLRTLHDTLYPEAESGQTVICIINAGVTIGSTSTSVAAFIVGLFAAGVTVVLDVRGRIQGKGGNGGNGGGGTPGGSVGLPGGVALYTRQAISLKVSTGEIFGGGGGGGGGGLGHALVDGSDRSASGGGGGGGQGTQGSSAGVSSTAEVIGFNGTAGSANSAGAGGAQQQNFPGFGYSITGGAGGNGGSAGAAGSSGSNGGYSDGGPFIVTEAGFAGGAAGAAIDGNSFVTVTEGPGDIRGSQIN